MADAGAQPRHPKALLAAGHRYLQFTCAVAHVACDAGVQLTSTTEPLPPLLGLLPLQFNAPDKPLPQVCEGAKQIAAYRSRRGMANCVVAPSPAPGSVAGSSSESMAMLLAELEDETTVSNRVLTFDPLDFQANFHDDGHQALASHPGDRRRRRRSSNSNNSGRSWTDFIVSTLSNKALDSLLRGKNTSTMQQQRLQSVDEDASVAYLDFHCGTHGVQEKGVRRSASMQRPRARPWQPEPGATSGSEPSEPLNKRVLLRKTSSAR